MRIPLLLVFATMMLATSSLAQPMTGTPAAGAAPQRENPFERVMNAPGSLFKKEYTDIAELKKMKVRLIKVSGIKDEKLQFNMACFTYEYRGANIPDAKTANIDAGTAEELRASFTEIQSKVMSKTPSGYTEVAFKTVSGITAGCYWAQNTWNIYIKLLADDSDSYVYMEKDELPKLLAALEQVKTKLAAKP